MGFLYISTAAAAAEEYDDDDDCSEGFYSSVALGFCLKHDFFNKYSTMDHTLDYLFEFNFEDHI